MIRFKDKVFEQYSICPATGDIFDSKTGEVQTVKFFRGRSYFKGMSVHRIMAHTFFGYKPGLVVHHLDENKLNNALSNLVYLTRGEHMRLHREGKKFSEEHKAKLSAALKGKTSPNKGKTFSEEHRAKLSAARKGKPSPNKGKPAWNKGRSPSPETRAKMREAALLREAKKRKPGS